MKNRLLPLIGLVLALLQPGCGTLVNLNDDGPGWSCKDPIPTRTPYGGVARDFYHGGALLSENFQASMSGTGTERLCGPVLTVATAGALAVELPCSLVGDTVTLPYVLLTGPGKSGKQAWDEIYPPADCDRAPDAVDAAGKP
jgi:uncharacterized protein YceK